MRQERLRSLGRDKFMQIGGRIEDFSCNFFEISHVIALPSRIGLSQNSLAAE